MKNGLYLSKQGEWTDDIDEILWHEAFVTASQKSMPLDAEVVSMRDILNAVVKKNKELNKQLEKTG